MTLTLDLNVPFTECYDVEIQSNYKFSFTKIENIKIALENIEILKKYSVDPFSCHGFVSALLNGTEVPEEIVTKVIESTSGKILSHFERHPAFIAEFKSRTKNLELLREFRINIPHKSFVKNMGLLDKNWERHATIYGIDVCDIKNNENSMKNFEYLSQKFPKIFSLRVINCDSGMETDYVDRHYIAECVNISDKEIISKIVELTPNEILEEILTFEDCKKKVYDVIFEKFSKRASHLVGESTFDLEDKPEYFKEILSTIKENWHLDIMPNCNSYKQCDYIEFYSTKKKENVLENLEYLKLKEPLFFELMVVKTCFLDGGSEDFDCHYLAECKEIKDQDVMNKIVSLTPTKVLQEIMETRECRYQVFLTIIKELESRD